MGAKDSKPAFLTYEEACKRVSDAELKRLKDSFKRYAGANSYMNRNTFIKEVLGDGVPPKLAELLFMACSGNQKGIGFKELVCGLVLLTRGRQDEKLKFLFSLYCNPGSNLIQKADMDALILDTEGHLPQSLSLLFRDNDQITYECFQKWVLQNQEVTSLTKWLLKEPSVVTLSNNLETPTFYQTLAGVTHLEEPDIIELETRYWQLKSQSKTGRFDMETFQAAVCPPVPRTLAQGLFAAFDENFDGHIDFKEMACGISACCRGPFTERLKFCFKVFDKDHDGLLSRNELTDMVAALLVIHHDNKCALGEVIDASENITPESMAEDVLSKHDSDADDYITQEEFLVWAICHPLPTVFTTVLFQVCHIVLGLKPQNKKDEGLIVKGWLKREEQHGLAVGQTWYLVAMQWWQQWQAYIYCQTASQGVFNSVGDNLSLDTCPSPDPGGGVGSVTNDKKSHSRSGSLNLCPGLSWKSSIAFDESVPVSLYQVGELSKIGDHSMESSPIKSATLPRSSLHHTANHVNSSVGNSSPRMAKKLDGVMPVEIAKPGPIENSPLTMTSQFKVPTLTNEGAHLRRDKTLLRGRDFELVSEPVWKALSAWYGGSPALPRNVIQLKAGAAPELELYPLCIQLLKHQVISQRANQVTSFSGMMGGLGGMIVNSAGLTNLGSSVVPRRYLAYTAVFSRKHTLRQVYEFLTNRLKISREELRLWKFKDEQNMSLLEDEQKTMVQLGIEDNSQLLIEVRNKDLTWPEEMSQIAKNKTAFDRSQQGPTERGATGLSNLGNTCFMNAALQCVSNTQILTQYFCGGMHLYELNRTNPLGMKGHLAQRYGELIKDLWSGNSKCVAPLKFRWTIGRYAPRFNGFQQHDSQELLAFLLDGLHEDLNRVHEKPYVELKDSDGRPDSVVAKEAWDNHLLRNKSIVVDLFHGQLKSTVRCCYCGNTSVRFDPFTFLSLPLPMDSSIHIELQVMWLDGSLPTKYGLRLNIDEKYGQLKKQLSELCGIPSGELLLVELLGASVRSLPDDKQKVKAVITGGLYAYQLKPPSKFLTSEPVPSATTLEGLAQIQREYTGSSPVRRLKLSQETSANPVMNGKLKSSSDTSQEDVQANVESGSLSTSSDCDNKSANPAHLVNGNSLSSEREKMVTNSNGDVRKEKSECLASPESPLSHFIIAVHRKMIRMDLYFLSSQKTCPSLFGIPLILPCDEKTTRLDLYHLVWTQVARLVSPLPPSETANPNHAHDCDDSLGYEYPFTLKAVSKDGMTCAWCPWYRFCRGCKLECDQEMFAFGTDHIAVDWEPTALHLRYQSSQERVFEEHSSVAESRRKQTEPISLDSCLQAFTKEEELGDQELYYCSKCREHRQALKKLEIWKLPPILIIHLKRFQYHDGRWIKSHKIVQFPKRNFDPSCYVVPRLKTTDDYIEGALNEEDNHSSDSGETATGRSKRHLSTSSETDYTTVKYDLFAMSCHIGILGGGHYVAYARNPNKKWYCYNDSSCKELSEDQIDTNSAYILFYERQTLNQGKFMPDINGKEPDITEIDDVADSDLRKMCVLQ